MSGSRTRLVCAVAAVAAVVLSGCGTLMPGASTRQNASGGGATGDSVRVDFVTVDLKKVADLTGFKVADAGDPAAQVKALQDWVNAHGGVGGKRLDAVYLRYDASLDSPAAEEQLCNRVTQDHRAFAAYLDGQFHDNARPCYAKAGTIMLDGTLVSTDVKMREDMWPYLWSPTFPHYDTVVPSLVSTLVDEGFFTGRDRVGVVVADTPVNRRLMADLAIPLLKKVGVTPEVAWVDTTDQGTLFQGNDAAVVTFRSRKIDRVMFLGGSRIGAIFTTVAAAQSYQARYAISTLDNPLFFQKNPETIPPSALKGMVGIGWIPSLDLADAQYRFPQGKPEKRCLRIYSEAGITFDSREAARVALPLCDAARMFKMAGDRVDGELTAESWAKAAAGLGTRYQSAGSFGGGYRVMRYDDGCSCFTYRGPLREFG